MNLLLKTVKWILLACITFWVLCMFLICFFTIVGIIKEFLNFFKNTTMKLNFEVEINGVIAESMLSAITHFDLYGIKNEAIAPELLAALFSIEKTLSDNFLEITGKDYFIEKAEAIRKSKENVPNRTPSVHKKINSQKSTGI